MQQQTSSTSSFKRFLLRFLLPLVAAVAVGGVLFSYLFQSQVIFRSPLCGAYKVHRILTEVDKDEIPILGSSRAEGSFIPDSLGNHFFNYGLSGTKYDVLLFFLEEECKKNKTTPILINMDLDGLKVSLGDIANYLPDAGYPQVRKLLGKEYKAWYAIPFIKYYGMYENYTRTYANSKLQVTKVTNKGASLEKNVLTKKAFDEMVQQRIDSKSSFYINASIYNQLFNIIRQHRERMFIFCIAPYHPSYYQSFKADAANTFFAALAQEANVRMLDYGRFPLPDSMYLNTTHINYKGAVVFNKTLRDTLQKLIAAHP